MVDEKSSAYFRGLVISPSASGLNKISVSPGFFIPGKQQDPYWNKDFTYVNDETDIVVDVTVYNDGVPHLDYIVATPRNYKLGEFFAGLSFKCKTTPVGKKRDEDPEFPNSLNNNEILLGFIFNPGIKLSNGKIVVRSINKEREAFSFILEPSDFKKKIIYGLEEWKLSVFYIKGQLVYHEQTLYYCKLTHTSSTNFQVDKIYHWLPLGSMNVTELTVLIEGIINGMNIETIPAPPVSSVQFNLDGNEFGGSENFLWNNDTQIALLNGELLLVSQKNSVAAPVAGAIKVYAEEVGNMLYLKAKLNNGREYIITSLQK